MSKKFNVNDIVNERKNELDSSPLFQSKPTLVPKDDSTDQRPQKARMPENQNAGNPAQRQSSMLENQNASKLAIQHNTTATEKVTYRFHSEGKYAIEDMKTILARKVGIKASYELIAEEAILIAYEDLLENQHARKQESQLASMLSN